MLNLEKSSLCLTIILNHVKTKGRYLIWKIKSLKFTDKKYQILSIGLRAKIQTRAFLTSSSTKSYGRVLPKTMKISAFLSSSLSTKHLFSENLPYPFKNHKSSKNTQEVSYLLFLFPKSTLCSQNTHKKESQIYRSIHWLVLRTLRMKNWSSNSCTKIDLKPKNINLNSKKKSKVFSEIFSKSVESTIKNGIKSCDLNDPSKEKISKWKTISVI